VANDRQAWRGAQQSIKRREFGSHEANAPPQIPLDEGDIRGIKERFLLLNRERLKRVRDAINPAQRDFFDLLPLLFHTNHPLLPGFVSTTTPIGISEYTPSRATLAAARRVARSFDPRRRAVRTVNIHSLALMGSSGTVAYSRESDFDIWVCHRPDLTEAEREELSRKTDGISEWAGTLGLEVHFFHLSADAFRAGEAEALSSESSGSTQHYLLLDEFYRTGLLIAGRYPIWWLVPPRLEHQYHEIVRNFRVSRLVPEREFLDFGAIGDLPVSEFVGAAMWQLTKAIGSPHKSLLKLMLLEAYASEYPQAQLLSARYKEAVYNGERRLDTLDPYVLFTRKVEEYLSAAGDTERLELARECFYLKVNVPLSRVSRIEKSWRTELVQDLVKEWGWSPQQLARLDARPHWKVDEVITERNAVVKALTHAYKLITRFGGEQANANRVSERDMIILGRKLFAAFEHKAGKIEIVNHGVDNDLAERQLTMVRSQETEGVDTWSLHRGMPFASQSTAGEVPPIRLAATLIELLVWCYFNGVLARDTRVHIADPDIKVTNRDIDALYAHLRQHFPLGILGSPSVDALARPPELLAASTFVNVGIDPMASYTRQGRQLTSSHADALSYGGLHENLIRGIDCVFISSWREVLVHSFQGMHGLLQSLGEHLAWVRRSNRIPVPSVPCTCFTEGYAQTITSRLSKLFEDVTAWYRADPDVTSKLYILKGEAQYYALSSENGEVRSDTIGPMSDLIRFLGQPRDVFTRVTLDTYALAKSPLELVYRHAAKEHITCQFHVQDNFAHLFIVDEHGALFHDRVPYFSDITLVRHLRAFFESVEYRQNSRNLDNGFVDPAPRLKVSFHRVTRAKDNTYRLREIEDDSPPTAAMGFNVQVIGEQADGQTKFTLYCDGHEFSTLEHGENVFAALAEHVLRKRSGQTRYPIFITDIDLSRLHADPNSERRLQTIHYLHYKKRIDDRLSAIVLS